MAQVILQDVGKCFGDKYVVRGVNLTVKDNEFVVLVGPSGCGKTTTLRMIAGLEEISEGNLFIDGVRANDLPSGKRGISMVFQSYALYPHMTVEQNMGFGLKLQGTPKQEIDRAVQKAAEVLGIEQLLPLKPGSLSGGQRQRVAIGRCISRHPKVFLFDEPLSNLDAALRIKMRVEFSRLHKVLNATMIYVTHDQIEAMTLADRIVVFSAGRTEQIGTPLDLYHHPANLFVAGFIGSPKMNFLDAAIEMPDKKITALKLNDGTTLDAAFDSMAHHAGDRVKLGIRPENFFVKKERAGSAPFGSIHVKVSHRELTGDSTLVYGESALTKEHIVARLNETLAVRDGEELDLYVLIADAHLFDANGEAFPRSETGSR